MKERKRFHAGFVALVGEPNAGKSSLLNAVLGEKVSIVSDKPQTTRVRVTGILNVQDAQVVFVDAPGTLKSSSGINRFLQEEVSDVLENSDVICALFAADATEASVRELVAKFERAGKPWVAIVTKSDLLAGTRTPRFFEFLLERKIPFVSISSLKRPEEAKQEILTRIIPLLPESPGPLYDGDLYTTQTIRHMAGEFVREACFSHLRQEVPYGLAVRVTEFNENGAVLKIGCEIVVDRTNHKGIVIGHGGQTLKAIGKQARLEIERLVGRQVFLQLHVHVKEDWAKNPRLMKELGYVVPKD